MVRRTWFVSGIAALSIVAALDEVAGRQRASRPAEEWTTRLERPERVAGLQIDYVISKLELKPGQVVADIGAGPGVFSLPLAKAVLPGGTVYAVEIDQGFLDRIEKKLKDQNIANVRPVLGKFTDPNLPARDVDLAFFHDVLHHVEDRAGYLKALAPYVRPHGRVAIIELAENGSHRDEPDLVVTKDQVKGWMADAGFKPVQEIDGLRDNKWFIVYAR